MAGGDLLYIFAFIILPTAVLVSCIWALLLLRKGALLPVRPALQRDISHEITHLSGSTDHEFDLVEETGEHSIIEPLSTTQALVTPARMVAAPVAATANAGHPVIGPSLTDVRSALGPAVVEPPAAERTQELAVLPEAVLPEEVADADDTHRDLETSADEPLEAGYPTATPETRGIAAQSTDAASDAAPGVVIVPLDEPSRTAPSPSHADERRSVPTASPAASRVPDAFPDESGIDGGQTDSPPSTASSTRGPIRRIAHLRSAEEATARPRPRAGQRRSPRQPDGET